MKKNMKIFIIIAIVLLSVILLSLVGYTILLFTVRSLTMDTAEFIEECPLPAELKYEKVSDIMMVEKSSREDVEAMVEWCCNNYDSSRLICEMSNTNSKK